MIALIDKLQQNMRTLVLGHREPHAISAPVCGQPRALARVAQIAVLAQLSIGRAEFGFARSACSAESRAQRQPRREVPLDVERSLLRKEEGTSHVTHILLSKLVDCVEFFFMSEMNRLQMLTQFLELNPGDAFARYGLAMEYSKAGRIEDALSQFSRLLQLHPDYTNGYFMAAQTLERAGRTPEARTMLEKGMEAAQRTGNKHALSEMTGMLQELQ